MAYAALISLDQTLHRLLNSPDRISISTSSQEELKNVLKLLDSLKEVLESLGGVQLLTEDEIKRAASGDAHCIRKLKRFGDAHARNSERLTSLDGQIRDELHSFEDRLDSILSDKFLSLSSTIPSLDLHTDEVWQEMKTFEERVKNLGKEFDRELDSLITDEDDNAAEVARSSYIDFGVDMVGRSTYFTGVKDMILRRTRPTGFAVLSILGVLGTGRTAVAKGSFEDLLTKASGKYFDCGAWVTVGADFQTEEIINDIISQLGESSDHWRDYASTPSEHLSKRLKNRRYMVVIDDVHEVRVWYELRSSFPDDENGSVVMFTTGMREVAIFTNSLRIFEMPVYGEKESWEILQKGIFGEKSCPLELEDAGKKIANNCGGRSIALAKLAVTLLKAERKVEIWNALAEDKENPIFIVVDELYEISKIGNSQLSNSISDDQREATSKTITEMISLTDFKKAIEKEIFPAMYFSKMGIIFLIGMAGIGKTKLAKKVVKDREIFGRFDNHVWLTLGPKYKAKNIVSDILATLSPPVHEVNLERYPFPHPLHRVDLERNPILAKRWLIVLDDVWDLAILKILRASFPDIRGRILVTTTQSSLKNEFSGMGYSITLLNEEESWSLFCKKVFPSGSYPHELEKAGKKIAKNCEGLPLLILTVADALSKFEDMTPQFWNTVANNKQHSVLMDAHEAISKVLYPSYEYLPQYIRMCYLYMGAFPQNYEIRISNLIKLLSTEGFLMTLEDPMTPIEKQSVVTLMIKACLSGLESQHLVTFYDANCKSYTLHSSFWYLSNSIAKTTDFLHVLDIHAFADDSTEYTKKKRRLSIRKSTVLLLGKVNDIIKSNSSCARVFLCSGPVNQYPVPIYLGLRLLRVLNALTLRSYEFPVEVVELIHLKYLALTCDGSLPPSISKLSFLQFLIINRCLSIISPNNSVHLLPMEIWDMKELKHVQVPESILLDPTTDDACLPNLTKLLDVSACSCTRNILKRIPNLTKLGILIELPPGDDGEDLRCLNLKSSLSNLESLNYVIVNPELMSEAVAPSVHMPMFLSSLKKLKLSGLGFPWEYMNIIGKLEKLEVLNLQCYAFSGPEWNIENDGFTKLKDLLIEDSDLMHWKVKRSSFPALQYFSIKHCYELEELPYRLSNCMVLINVVDCNPFVEKWARQMKEKHKKDVNSSRSFGIDVVSSWEKNSRPVLLKRYIPS